MSWMSAELVGRVFLEVRALLEGHADHHPHMRIVRKGRMAGLSCGLSGQGLSAEMVEEVRAL